MNQFALRMFVRSILAEAKDKKADDKTKDKKAAAPKKAAKKEPKKSSGNLVEMKKDLAALKEKSSKIDDLIKEWEQVKSAAGSISYGGEQAIEIGADAKEAIIEDCDKEIEKLKKEKEGIDKEIADLKENTTNEINKIKEMMGLTSEKKNKEEIVDESFKSTKKKIEKNIRSSEKKKGESTKGAAEYAQKVAGKIAQAKAHGAGSGPTEKQKARMK